jgi:GNAT superfamily N-acetyltransferase
MSNFTLRPATAEDVPQILAFIRALAEYEREPDQVVLTEAELLRDGFGPRPLYRCLFAEIDGKLVGFALFFSIYSTWRGPSIHLEDLFVYPEARGKGIGKALLTKVAAIALEEGCRRLQWDVLEWNTPAIGFYESLGAVRMMDWRVMRVMGENLPKLAAMSKT